MTKVIARVHPVHLMNADWAPGGHRLSEKWLLPFTSTIATVIITQPVSWYSFYRPTDSRRLSRPRHCSKGAQPMPKAVYRSGCRDKHKRQRCDSNLGPLTPQSDALTTRPLRHGDGRVKWIWNEHTQRYSHGAATMRPVAAVTAATCFLLPGPLHDMSCFKQIFISHGRPSPRLSSLQWRGPRVD